MTCCSSSGATQSTLEPALDALQFADRLAALLSESPEYLEFVRLSNLINYDPDVQRISREIRNRLMIYPEPDDAPLDMLRGELEALPAVQTFRKAEAALRDLFHAVDRVISTETGIAFAANAIKSACG
jgi:cell fate (sporulation/competence/biofilm development) regulator YlbF (YheA/YmcA/DUF963 family)